MSNNLNTFNTKIWLRNRYKQQVKDKYILYDNELKEQNMMKAVFNSIDRDKSKFLDRSELYDMFIKFGINIDREELKQFFKSIDEDEDDKLNWSDFKQALKNQDALDMFKQLMIKLRNMDPNSSTFIPLSFPQMIQYMNYCVLREELIQQIESDEINNFQKHKQCVNLLTLEDSCYRNIKYDKNEEEEDSIEFKKYDPQQIAKLKRFQEQELKFKRLENINNIKIKTYYTNSTSDCLNEQQNINFNNSQQQINNKDLEILRQEISKEIKLARKNVDKYLAILNAEKFISREHSRIQSRDNKEIKLRNSTLEMKQNSVLIQAKQEIFQQKFKKIRAGSHFTNQKYLYPRKRMLSQIYTNINN